MSRTQEELFAEIESQINNNEVVLYMKGNKDMPMCGFSATVVAILKKLNVEFYDVNILEDQEIREAIKAYTDWPTIPQLYVKGEFVGGCDIVKEMYQDGELMELLKQKEVSFSE
ncbi:MAG: Grx4 family monothiol glutaredoxin [Alphaproteobacteria bacterium]|nr:Grx4 family monothiol glutaredoxin [Alphaproteobacteria bacterium]OJV16293.1 MAG: monothiol glutaredoxin, Grx4 family [Alphaproteobacteria bacterium 33-17]